MIMMKKQLHEENLKYQKSKNLIFLPVKFTNLILVQGQTFLEEKKKRGYWIEQRFMHPKSRILILQLDVDKNDCRSSASHY